MADGLMPSSLFCRVVIGRRRARKARLLVDGLWMRRYESSVGAARSARAAVAEFAAHAGMTGERLDDLRVCVSEAVTNAVVHGYPDRDGGVAVVAELTRCSLRVIVSDDGDGLKSQSPAPGLGLGLTLMRELADELTIRELRGGGVEVHLCFSLAPCRAPVEHERQTPAEVTLSAESALDA